MPNYPYISNYYGDLEEEEEIPARRLVQQGVRGEMGLAES